LLIFKLKKLKEMKSKYEKEIEELKNRNIKLKEAEKQLLLTFQQQYQKIEILTT
jgi:hypothetical protein